MHTPDPLLQECFNAVVRRYGPEVSDAELLWASVVAYLFAVGEIAESNISTAIH